ncbi:hypothetical protein GMW39_03635 [Pectobacterium parmentieri]|uniref:hypothetical protein n=1 Tax=Pectobacterium parmentieri TaxID=1905730 RepID=UPI00047404B4|nr:hypothetical protein [Pectobacterium parmentieri]AYH15223.1 hypothetical protein C5E23_14105 [Pectobacterium parmentieri]POW30552.1 hypothetical protein PB20LOC_00444 [Pectobacterium parmentieri]PWD64710.1 hypothetical protein DF211_09395 [Pectobacterium parmentieri]QHQ15047.1 hypothetical protein GMW39_03635 [Pectobacterium parmentieri]QPK18185.1 hypothetical protein PB20LOC_011780 [Pectobacterium parmentieri]
MKIESGENNLFTHRASIANSTVQTSSRASFAAILAGKTQETSVNNAPASSAKTKQYDFTNMTPQELNETVNSLIQSGQMDLDESTSLLGFMAPTALSKVVYDGTAPVSSRQPMNVFSKIQEGIDGALSRNEKASAESLQRAADALLRFQDKAVKVTLSV